MMRKFIKSHAPGFVIGVSLSEIGLSIYNKQYGDILPQVVIIVACFSIIFLQYELENKK